MLTEVVHKLVRGKLFYNAYIFYGEFKYAFTACILFPVAYKQEMLIQRYIQSC